MDADRAIEGIEPSEVSRFRLGHDETSEKVQTMAQLFASQPKDSDGLPVFNLDVHNPRQTKSQLEVAAYRGMISPEVAQRLRIDQDPPGPEDTVEDQRTTFYRETLEQHEDSAYGAYDEIAGSPQTEYGNSPQGGQGHTVLPSEAAGNLRLA